MGRFYRLMKKYLKFNILNRLILALLISISVVIGYGIFTVLKIHNLGDLTKDIYKDPLKVSNTAIEARVNILKIQREMKDLLLTDDENIMDDLEVKTTLLNNRVLLQLELLDKQAEKKEVLLLVEEIRELFLIWRRNQEKMIKYKRIGSLPDAIEISFGTNVELIEKMEAKLVSIDNISQDKAKRLVEDTYEIEESLVNTIKTLMLVLGLFLTLFFIFIIRSILKPIKILNKSMDDNINAKELKKVQIEGNNEIVDISRYYNQLIEKLNNLFWIKDSQNQLNEAISGDMPINELTQKALNFLARTVGAGKGAYYLYDQDKNVLKLTASFAFTEREHLSNEYQLGEGIVGQVALEKEAILLKNVIKKDEYIITGTYQEVPNNIYTFPLLCEGNLYGVIELALFEEFSSLKQEFIIQAAKIVTINLFSALQREKIKDLLKASEVAQTQAKLNANELQKANTILEEQQQQLHQQTAELQQTNAELEEQQQLLQQQSEELQQTNTQLEEQQQILEQQSNLLNMNNTELEKSKIELINYSQKLELSNKYKSEFLTNMSHELRTPLNSIILLSRLLMNNKNELQQDDLEKVEVIHSSGRELLRLINDVLDLSKIEAGKTDLNISKFHSSELTRELRLLFTELAQNKNLKFNAKDSINLLLMGDRDKISQILRNLIANAIKFTQQGSVNFTIVSDIENKGRVIFKVEDTGIGINKENFSSIFEEFKQEDGSISRRFGGTGLGLSISKKLAELIDGGIIVESSPNEGSCFSLFVDNIIVDEKYNTIVENSTIALEESAYTTDEETISHKDKVILIIEDDFHFANYIKEINEGLGFKTLTAKNGSEGLYYLKNYNVDGIILDLKLEDEKELRDLKLIKYFKDIKLETPIIIYTEKDLTEQQEREIKKYVDSIIIKTSNLSERFIDEVTLFLHRIKKVPENSPYLISKTNIEYSLSLHNKKILIVDDDTRNIFVLATALEEYGAEILEAENGKIALSILKKQKVDLILMDIMMPEMDGFETIKSIRKDQMLKEMPIIAITAKSLKEDRDKCIMAGANDYISKPVNYDVLIRLVKAWIEKS